MNQIEKLLIKIPKKDRIKIAEALKLLYLKKLGTLDRKKLKGYSAIYRIRVGNYRIIYFDDGQEIILKAIRKRDESTYSDF